MKSLSDFGDEKIEKEKTSINQNFDEEEIKSVYEKYKDLPEDELLKTLFIEVEIELTPAKVRTDMITIAPISSITVNPLLFIL